MVNLSATSNRQPSVLVHQPAPPQVSAQPFVLDLSGLDPNTQWIIILVSTVLVCLAVAILLCRQRGSIFADREPEEIVIKGSDLRARESMKTIRRGPVESSKDDGREFLPAEVRILPFGEKFYRDRFTHETGECTPKGSLGGTTIIGDRTFQKGRLAVHSAIREEAMSIRSFKASEQSFLDRQLNMSGRNSFVIEPRHKHANKSLRSQNYSTMADEDEDEVKNFLDNLDFSFEADYDPSLKKREQRKHNQAQLEC